MKLDTLDEKVYSDSENFCDYLIKLHSTYPDSNIFWDKMMKAHESQTFNFIKYDIANNNNITNISCFDKSSIRAFMDHYTKQFNHTRAPTTYTNRAKFDVEEIMLLRKDKLYMIPTGESDKYYNIVNYSILSSMEAFKFIINSRENIKDFDDREKIEQYLRVAYVMRNFEVIHILEEKFPFIVKQIDYDPIIMIVILQMIKSLVLIHYIPSMNNDLCSSMLSEYCDELNYILTHYSKEEDVGEKMTTFDGCENLEEYYIKVIKNSIPDTDESGFSKIEKYSLFSEDAVDTCLYLFMMLNDDAYEAMEKMAVALRIKWKMEKYLQMMSEHITEIPLGNFSKALAHSPIFDSMMKGYMMGNGYFHKQVIDFVIALCRDRKKLNFPIEEKLGFYFNDDVEYYNIKEEAIAGIVRLVVAVDECGIDLEKCMKAEPVEFVRKVIKALYYNHVVSRCVKEIEKLNKIKNKYSPEE